MPRRLKTSALIPTLSSDEKISVCLATYNGALFLEQQIDSILVQMQEGDELLISDDGSTDETKAILASYGSALRVIGSERVGGVVPNFSRVLGQASKAMVVLADQDDVWLDGRLQCIRDVLATAELVLTNASVTDERLEPIGSTLFEQLATSAGFWRNVTRSSFVGCCMGFRRSLLETALPLPSGTPWHDWLLGLLASIGGHVALVPKPLLLYRRHGANASPTGQASGNGTWHMVKMRLLVVYAVAVCLVRCRLRQLRRAFAGRPA